MNSEIAQRFGIYKPAVRLSMTSLDVHDFNQPSLDIPVGEYIQLFGSGVSALGATALGTAIQLWGMLPTNAIIPTGNFLDPDVQRWSNIDFAEHYYQILASNTALPVGAGIVSTPNGRFVPNFDVSINLNGRAGFTTDDGLATATALSSGSLRPGGPHSRVWRWYGATTDLSVIEFNKGGEPVFRRLADKDAIEFQGVTVPWYNAQSFALGFGPSEGIGTGWAFSPQGGVPYAGAPSNNRVPVTFDNSETMNASGLPVPSVFNGDFEEGALNRSWLLQYSAGGLATNLTGDLPGWSFHGGGFEKTYAPGDRLITLANGTHAAMLDNDNSWIRHNRMVVPDWAEYLSFDVRVVNAAVGETLRVEGYVPDTGAWIDLGSVALDSQGNNFGNRLLAVPVDFRGAERMLKFSLSGGGSANAEIWLDHVQFMRGLIADSTTDPNDKGVFFSDTATGPTTGFNSQWVELTNRFPDPFTVTVTTDPNDFLVVVDGAFEKLLNDNQAHAPLYDNFVVNPGGTLHLDLKARFSDDFVKTYTDADLPIEKTALYFTITLGNGSVRDEVVDLFYLPDFADGDASDGVWTMIDTLDGKTRTLAFDNAAQVDVKPLSNPTGQFSVDETGGIAQGIKYQSVYSSPIDDFAEFQIEEGGRNLGKITVKARAVEKQTVGVSLATLRTMVQAIRTEYDQWVADPTTPVHDANGFATGNYGIFASLFSPVITDAEWADVLSGFHTVFGKDPTALGPVYAASIYLPSIQQNEFSYAENGLNPIVMINRPWVNATDNDARSFAGLDFAYTSFENKLTEAGAGAGSFGGKVLRDDISIPAKRFLLSQVVNPVRTGAMAGGSAMTLVVDGILRAYLNVGDTRHDVGKSFGWVVGHELAHNLGLFDEYIYNPFQSVPRNGGDNFMSTANTVTVANRQREALHLAMDNPDTTVSLAGTNALAAWYLDLNALDASNRPGRGVQALSPGAGDGDPEADPLTALLAFIGLKGAATSGVTSQPLLLNGDMHSGIVNGGFDVADTTAIDYGWTAVGQAGVVNGQGVVNEDPRLASRLVQTFVVPDQAQLLRFELLGADFVSNEEGPADAFEVALLDLFGNAVAGTIPVGDSDALFNLQAGGKVFAAPSVSATGLVDRNGGTLPVGQPVTVSIDLSGIASGTVLTLYFDLLGFSGAASRLRIDNVGIITVGDSNNVPPVASSSAITASEEGAAVALGLSAPTDVDSPLLSITVNSLPILGEIQYANGSAVSINDTLSSAQLLGLKYLPPAEYNGRDAVGRFTYSVSDGVSTVSGETAIALTAVNDAPVASSSAIVASEEGAAVTLALSAPSDVDSAVLNIVVTALPALGEVQYADGSALRVNDVLTGAQLIALKYLAPTEYNGSDPVGRFTYRVSDGSRTATGETTITLIPVNDAPVASGSAITADEGGAAVALGLSAPTDVDSPLLTIVVSGLPALGAVQYADGSAVRVNDALSSAQLLALKYLPPGAYNSNDVVGSFSYRVSDGSRSAIGETAITVIPANYAPVASSSAIVAVEEAPAVLLGLSAPIDVDSPSLTIAVSGLPTIGEVQYADGSAVRLGDRPSSAQLLALKYLAPTEYNGSDPVGRFSYTVSDGQRTAIGETTITVTPVNDPPLALADSASVDVHDSVLIDVLANDSDAENQVLTLVSAGGAARGSVVIENGKLRYTPLPNSLGADRFSYLVSDSGGATATGTVDVLVTGNHAPTLAALVDLSVSEGGRLTVNAVGSDVDPGDILSYSLTVAPAGASIDPNSGTIVWQALDGSGSYDFSVRVVDRAGASASGNFTANVLNVAPTLSIAGLSSTYADEVYALTLSSQDPGDDTISNWRVDWGDGQVIDYAGNPMQLEHRYTGVFGPLQIRATATDEDGSYLVDPLPLTVLPRSPQVVGGSGTGGASGGDVVGSGGAGVDRVDRVDALLLAVNGLLGSNQLATRPPVAASNGDGRVGIGDAVGSGTRVNAVEVPAFAVEPARSLFEASPGDLPQIDFRPRPAGFRLPIDQLRRQPAASDDWRKAFVTDMAKKPDNSDNPNNDLRVTPGPSLQSPAAPAERPEDASESTREGAQVETPAGAPEGAQEGTANRNRQAAGDGQPVAAAKDDAPADIAEASADGKADATLDQLLLVLPLAPFQPVFFKSILGRRTWQTRRSKPQRRPPATRDSASG
ncbi:MAG: tandem-95 repeat protein [Candidatus Accumulibacter sp.]|nr:tandem-95 repeat protein [Accumulibacter sp.]